MTEAKNPIEKNQPGLSRSMRPGRLASKLDYARWLPSYAWQRLTRSAPRGNVHMIIALADHFEPAVVPGNGRARAALDEQERRVEEWCHAYPHAMASWRDDDGRPFLHTYFYPAEQYDRTLLDRLAEHCRSGWGEIEVHLHHGIDSPDTAENTRRILLGFRDALVFRHECLSFLKGAKEPRYAFVHGNFTLANSASGYACGVDQEMQVLAETGCYADFTMPAASFHTAQIAKINSLYECGLPLTSRAPHRTGRDLRVGRPPKIFPINVQGPLMLDFGSHTANGFARIENAALTASNPPSLSRLRLWKQAAIAVKHRPDWLFIKLHCHSMDPTQKDSVLGSHMQAFLRELVTGAPHRGETLHFVTAREMVNIILAACDGREGDPAEYRDYQLKLLRSISQEERIVSKSAESVKA